MCSWCLLVSVSAYISVVGGSNLPCQITPNEPSNPQQSNIRYLVYIATLLEAHFHYSQKQREPVLKMMTWYLKILTS